MKRTIIYLSTLAMVISFQDAHAQSIRSMMKNKIIEDNLKAQARRDSVRAAEEGREPDRSPNTTLNQVYMDALGLSGNVDYESSYNFDAFIRMEVSEYSKNGDLDEKVIYNSYVNKEAMDYAMVFTNGRDQSTIIFDDKNDAMLILSVSNGEKTGFAMGMDLDATYEDYEEEEIDTSPYEPYKTGKRKTILGYSCDEYLVTDENSEARMWVSEQLGKQVRKEILANNQTFGAAFYHAAYMNGMVLEYDLLDKDDGERVVMQVTDIDLNKSHTISTQGYSVMSMGQQPQPEE